MKGKRKAKAARPARREGLRAGPRDGSTSIEREKELKHCEAYRVWVNSTGAAQTRSVSVFPVGGDFLPNTVTVFVAGPDHQGGPPGAGTTVIKPEGDSVGKAVPDGQAVFVHLNKPGGKKKARIDDGPV